MGIAEAVAALQERIAGACERCGRRREEIRLLGVSKFHGIAAVEEAWNAGIRLFGESRVQEASAKFAGFKPGRPGAELHLIGSLQRNKAKIAVGLFDTIQSVDRMELIETLGALTERRKDPLMILLEYHTAEESKSGFPDMDSLLRGAEKALEFPGLALRGLMTIAPYTTDEALIRSSFKAAASARDALALRFPGADWSCLSMGMSADFEIAIEEGSTLLRIGTALFGERNL
ncbi:MAG: YggS family pyridoxal phosphate-dependent enzyme [Treponema sp.]|jgi:pyridoxal phosphate enzyme (YggS family)|nr:YggS family pyridoxal phosphate-dependent enzyme [Treponema sp.]